MSKTRNEIITSMCYTYRHDYGLIKPAGDKLGAGMTVEQQQALWRQMSQIFDNNIAPYMEFKQ
jgi:hypothetical protein